MSAGKGKGRAAKTAATKAIAEEAGGEAEPAAKKAKGAGGKGKKAAAS